MVDERVGRVRSPVKRARAEHYLGLMLVSFAASVILTRLFLDITGYPRVGGGGLHIAHVLWGGLLLFVASLLPLIYANRWVYSVGAVLSGLGVGLFIDEVGKFITQTNNYFTPAAAPIIYAFFLLTVLVYVRVRRPTRGDPRTELYQVFEQFEEVLDRDLDAHERRELESQLEDVARHASTPDIARLANELLDFLRCGSVYLVRPEPNVFQRCAGIVRRWEARWVTGRQLTVVAVGGLGVLGALALSNLVAVIGVLLSPRGAQSTEIWKLASDYARIRVSTGRELGVLVTRLVLQGLDGAAMILAGLLILLRRPRLGMMIGYLSLLVALTMVDLLVFYFDQFAAVLGALAQFGLLQLLAMYRRHYLKASRHPDTGRDDLSG